MMFAMVSAHSRAQSPLPQSASPFSLAEIWQKVAVNSKVIDMKELELLQSKEQLQHAHVSRLPDVSLNGEFTKISNLPQFEDGILHSPTLYPISHTAYNLGASVYFDIYRGGQLNRRVDAQQINIKIKEQERNLSASEIKLLATAYYLDLLRGLAFQELLQQDIDEQSKVLLQIKAIYQNGVVLKSDVLRAELKLSKQHLQVDQINNENTLAVQKINLLMGRDEALLIEPSQPLLPDTVQLTAYETLLANAASGAPEINISKEERRRSELQLREVKGNILPSVGLFANYAYNYPQGRFYPYVLSLYGLGTVGLRASFPISSLFKNKHQVNSAALAVERSAVERKNTEDQIKIRLKEAYLQFQHELERIKVAKANITQATENLRIVKNSYLNQTSLITDYLDADVQLLQSKFDLSAARIAAQLQYYQIQKITGTL